MITQSSTMHMSFNFTHFIQSLCNNDLRYLKHLKSEGFDPNILLFDPYHPLEKHYATMLHYAAKECPSELIPQYLIEEYGSNINLKDDNGQTALYWAAEKGHTTILKLLIGYNANLYTQDNNHESLVHAAARAPHKECLVYLSRQACDFFIQDNQKRTALHFAAASGCPDSIEFLLNQGLDINAQDISGLTPLHYAAIWMNNKTLAFLLKNRSNVLSQDFEHEDTPLHRAVMNNNYPAIALLLKYGSNLYTVNKNKQTPFHIAARKKTESSLPAIKALLNLGFIAKLEDLAEEWEIDLSKIPMHFLRILKKYEEHRLKKAYDLYDAIINGYTLSEGDKIWVNYHDVYIKQAFIDRFSFSTLTQYNQYHYPKTWCYDPRFNRYYRLAVTQHQSVIDLLQDNIDFNMVISILLGLKPVPFMIYIREGLNALGLNDSTLTAATFKPSFFIRTYEDGCVFKEALTLYENNPESFFCLLIADLFKWNEFIIKFDAHTDDLVSKKSLLVKILEALDTLDRRAFNHYVTQEIESFKKKVLDYVEEKESMQMSLIDFFDNSDQSSLIARCSDFNQSKKAMHQDARSDTVQKEVGDVMSLPPQHQQEELILLSNNYPPGFILSAPNLTLTSRASSPLCAFVTSPFTKLHKPC